jgi:predicted hotdog family 3-hydroxylacyl-ACP dehydratase
MVPVSRLLPHGPEMTLIDGLVESVPDYSVATVRIRADSEFFEAGGVPAWVGIEYMAQTIAARIGYDAYRNGAPPPIGFLLGTRQYECCIDQFLLDSELSIKVAPLFVESGFGAFTCTIQANVVVARSVLNTYQPTDQFLADIQLRS